MRADRHTPHPRRFRQGGAAALMTLVFLLIVVGMAVVVALKMSGSDVFDTASQQNSVQALFLAESAVERTAQRLSGTACASLGTEGPISLGSGSFSVVAPAPYVDAGLCRVRVAGTVGSVTRTVDAWLSSSGGGAITADTSVMTTPYANASASPSVPYTVPAGASILLVGISINNVGVTINSVTYGGTPMTAGPVMSTNPRPRVRIYYLVNPPAGTANVVANLQSSSEVVMGARWFSGVNTATGATAPFDVAPASATGNGNPRVAQVSITPVTSGAWVFEALAIDQDDTTTMTAQANPPRSLAWFAASNGNVRGGASVIGPISPVTTQSPRWTWGGNVNKWVQVAVALRPGGGAPKVVQWTEVVQ